MQVFIGKDNRVDTPVGNDVGYILQYYYLVDVNLGT